jgi:hypothetical protein
MIAIAHRKPPLSPLSTVELTGKAAGKLIERLDHLPGYHLEQGRRRLHLETSAQNLPRSFDGVQLMPAARNE